MKPCDVIKAVEVFANDLDCSECPFYPFSEGRKSKCFYCGDAPQWFWEEILEVFARYKTEIDILIRKKEALRDEIEELQLKNSELKIELEEMRLRDGLQKAKIEELRKTILNGDFTSITAQKSNKLWHWQNNEKIRRLNEEIERLTKENHQFADIGKMLVEAKSEAIKEFAERLKEVGTKVEGGKGFEGVFVMANNLQIDNLVKEMTEGNGNA